MRFSFLITALLISTPAISEPLHSTPLTIHSDDIKKNCNDGYWWNSSEKLCMPGNGR